MTAGAHLSVSVGKNGKIDREMIYTLKKEW